MKRLGVLVAAVALLVGACSQQKAGSTDWLGGFSGLFGDKDAVRVGTTCTHYALLHDPPWFELQKDLSEHIERPVQFVSEQPFQIRSQLGTGRLAFALVDVSDYGEITREDVSTLMLAGLSPDGQATRKGLVITPADSAIQQVADLSGKRFAFGPKLDPVLHVAALELLGSEGIDPGDLSMEITYPFGHHANSLDIARAMLMPQLVPVAAGVVREEDFYSWPATGGTWVQPSQDQFRILAETRPVPQLCWVVSRQADAALAARVKSYLLEQSKSQPTLFEPLGLSGFAEPQPELYEPFCETIARHKLSKTPFFR